MDNYEIKQVSQISEDSNLGKEIKLAPQKIIGLTQGAFKKLKDKILELKAKLKDLRNTP